MKKDKPQVSIATLCGLFGLTRQAYYKANKRQEIQQGKEHLMLKKLKKLREEMPGVGTRKLQHLTVTYRKKHNIKIGRDKMHELLRKEDMLIRFRRRRTRTTYSDHSYVRYKNLIEDLQVTAINQLYVSDIRVYDNFVLVSLGGKSGL